MNTLLERHCNIYMCVLLKKNLNVLLFIIT